MTRRCLLFFSLLVALAALCMGAWLVWPGTAITQENAAKIEPGMTLDEVKMIHGGPARDETHGRIRFWVGSGYNSDGPSSEWTSCLVGIRVCFDGPVVYSCETWTPELIPQGPLDMLRRWFDL